VNPELAELVVKDGVRLGGERKTVAILFSDIRNFTAISEKLDPEEVVDFLNMYMTRMVECIDRTGGIVDKFIGDAIMAIWGVPVSKGNDTENAIDAALMMRKSLIEFNRDRGDPKNPIIRIGCGINTGPVLAGQIGSENRMEYTVIGDTVNLASRIEDLNKPFGTDILISEDTYKSVKEIYAVERMEPIKVKGKDKPQQIFAILGRLDDAERPGTIEELRVLLGLEKQPFSRRAEDREKGELKYEILEH
jgi:adenylate cyclase